MNEEIAQIERENRPFWSRMLRERFGREVALEVDWESFTAGSQTDGWVLYPLNIQSAGVERLLYAITGLMDQDEKFKIAAIDRIESLYVGHAPDIDSVGLRYRKGRLTYRCFAGDWNGYYTIDEIRWFLQGHIVRKSGIRKLLERWIESLSHDEASEAEPPPVPDAPAPLAEEPAPPAAPPVQDTPPYVAEEYDAALRSQLESLYSRFIDAVTEKDLDGLLGLVRSSRTDEETLSREMASDGFVSFAEWMLTVYPRLDQTTFISLKSEEDGLAGYYMAWVPPYTDEYLNLTLIPFEKRDGQWQIVFRISGAASAILQVRTDEHVLAKAQEVIRTNPLMELKPSEIEDVLDEELPEPELSEEMSRLKAEFEAVYATVYRALEGRDLEAFLSAVVVSAEDEEKLRDKPRNLFRSILENTPEPSKTIFVTLKRRGRRQAGLYFVAPYPHNPSFDFVYLRPFVFRDGRWRMVFSFDLDLLMNMSVATSGGGLRSRAMEVIDKIDLLNLEWVMGSLFAEII